MRNIKIIFISGIFAVLALNAFAQLSETTQKTLNYIVNHFKVYGYAQGGWNYYHDDDPNNEFTVNRIILMGDYRITDQWNAFIMFDFKKASLHEMWACYKPKPWLQIKAGQFKTPFSIENPISPVVMEMISQMSMAGTFMVGGSSALMMPGGAGRDIGLTVFGDAGKYVSYDLAVMNGAGRNRGDDNSWKDFVARLTFHPIKQLDISGSMILGKGNIESLAEYLGTTTTATGNYKRNRFAAGFQLKTKPVNLRGEWMWGQDDDLNTNGGYATLQVSNIGVKNLDFVASVDHLDLDTYDVNRYQAGLQYWFYKQCRLQANYSYTDFPGTDEHQHAVLTQLQVAF